MTRIYADLLNYLFIYQINTINKVMQSIRPMICRSIPLSSELVNYCEYYSSYNINIIFIGYGLGTDYIVRL